ncbi:beta-L-arabinofuranosidase domain-containing protein [Chitinophaga oryzae]|uniref:beta-L-arabinofuranosidase domain-containing protein n=1 Tax=Chitinophaga oryzae TaxID=2725414 RepID=UPI001FEC363A|nr:beta-L-arabinofuranosidase domain-containing protein [Chitinophaga oryzae]
MKKLLFALLALCTGTVPLSAQSYVPGRHDTKIKVSPGVPVHAYTFRPGDVQLLDGPFKQAMEADAGYLLVISPDRLLADFRNHAGLKAKGERYGGWESTGLAGHTLGHYLSACAMHYGATGDKRFLDRVNYIIQELEECQRHRKTGYLGAIPGEDTLWAQVKAGNIRSRGFDLNGGWSPWYTVHKIMAGLLDAYLYCDNKKALTIEKGMADWTGTIVDHLPDSLIQKMLLCEYGGMNDVLVNTYALTAEKKYLDMSFRFHDRRILDSLAAQLDVLPGKHSNTQIPKVIGCIRRYELTGSRQDSTIAAFFWNTVTSHHSYAPGGNSNYEYLGPADKLNDQLTDNTMETCNTYNMLKLTRHLFALRPAANLMDYYERGLYNHILASQNHQNGMMCYFVPLRMGARKEFSDSLHTFTCCVGSGMENHVKYGESIYFEGADGSLYVNLFIPSRLHWRDRDLTIEQTTQLPANDQVLFTIRTRKKTAAFPLRIRKPRWVKEGMQVLVNGQPQTDVHAGADGYISLDRPWKDGDQVTLQLPMGIYSEAMPDNPGRIALLYGPVVLAGMLGEKEPDPVTGIPVLVTPERDAAQWVTRDPQQPLAFHTSKAGQPQELRLVPFSTVQHEHYSVYWDIFTPQEWAVQQERYAAEKKRQQEIEASTVDILRPGEMQPERDHHFTADKTNTGEDHGRKWRMADDGGAMTFTMKVDSSAANSLLCNYWGMDNRYRAFDIFIDNVKVATEDLNKYKASKFYEIVYPLPLAVTRGKQTVTVKLQAHPGNSAGPVYGPVRTIRGAFPGAGEGKTDYPIQPVPFTQVHVSDNFWAPKIKVNAEVSIPYTLEQCKKTGRIDNFLRASGKLRDDKMTEYTFDDTDLYKVIEGASYGLQVRKNPELEKYLDTLIGIIGAAQEKDGYLYTFRTMNASHPHAWMGARRWEKEEDLSHELYNSGHLFEAAVAHYQATGKRTLLDIAIRNADLLVSVFGFGREERFPGHQIVETGLTKMYRVTGKKEYLDLAKFFLDVRGPGKPNSGEYNQSYKKVTEQHEAVGHAVRAAYMYTGMADVAALTGDRQYLSAIDDIWHDVVEKKLYVTGGIGATGNGEAFGQAYELPNMSAYAETCASIANVYWNSRMFLLHGDAKYIDVMERTLYNGLLSGVSLSGDRFFYPNPLASMGQYQRSAWFGCACCISNMTRFLPSMPGYIYGQNGNDLYVNLFVGNTADITLPAGKVTVTQQTNYPWDGKTDIAILPSGAAAFALHIRIPGWAANRPIPGDLYFDAPGTQQKKISILLNGQPAQYRMEKGYAVMERTWKAGDKISLDFPMDVQKLMADSMVEADKKRFALQRGPLVYCLEGPDNKDGAVQNIVVDKNAAVKAVYKPSLLNGVTVLEMKGTSSRRQANKDALVKSVQTVTAIPYYAWANRGPGEMTVWVPYEASAARPTPAPSIASKSKVSASATNKKMYVALNDQYDPMSSKDNSAPYFHWWPKQGTQEWVQYDFDQEYTVSSSGVYWYDDGPFGGCRVPASWKLFYKKGEEWLPVKNTGNYGTAKDGYNSVQFEPVKTSALKMEVQLPAENSSGILEWRVK